MLMRMKSFGLYFYFSIVYFDKCLPRLLCFTKSTKITCFIDPTLLSFDLTSLMQTISLLILCFFFLPLLYSIIHFNSAIIDQHDLLQPSNSILSFMFMLIIIIFIVWAAQGPQKQMFLHHPLPNLPDHLNYSN
jgi:hypothetical protein